MWNFKVANRPQSVHNRASEGMEKVLKQTERMYSSAVMDRIVCEKRVEASQKDLDNIVEEFETRATDLTLAMKQMDEYREQSEL